MPGKLSKLSNDIAGKPAYDKYHKKFQGLIDEMFADKEFICDDDIVETLTDEMHEMIDAKTTEYFMHAGGISARESSFDELDSLMSDKDDGDEEE